MIRIISLLVTLLLLQGCQLTSPKTPTQNQQAPTDLRIELLSGNSVFNIRDSSPEFSWVLPADERASTQVAYQIQVAKVAHPFDSRTLANTNEIQRLVWDSGKIHNTNSVAQSYIGEPLEEEAQYHWRVRTWVTSDNGTGAISPWSSPQRFSMAAKLDNLASFHQLQTSIIKPVESKTLPNGRVLIDFGKVAFGYLELHLTAEQSGTIDIHFGERGHLDGKQQGIFTNLHRGSSVRYYQVPLQVNARRDAYAVHPPRDERNTRSKAIAIPGRFGRIAPFRYVEIDAKSIDIKNITASQIAVHYPWDEHQSSFNSSDHTLNAIWDLCKYSMQATSFAGLYVDGDRERIPYEADAYINQLSHYYVDSEFSLARNSHEYLMRNPTWPTEWKQHSVMMAWADWRYTGDTESLRAHYTQLKQAKTLEQYASENYLISTYPKRNRAANMGDIVDWPPSERDGYELKNINTVVNAFYYLNLKQMADMALALGKNKEYQYYKNKAQTVKTAFNELLFDRETGLYIDGIGSKHSSAHANIAPLAFGLVPQDQKQSVIQFVKSRGMAVSVYFAQYLMEALYLNGEAEYALSLLTSKATRSWYNMLRMGSTITMEAWDDKFKPNQDWNHAWGAVPGNIIGRFILGVEPVEAGMRTISIKPQPAKLTFVEGYVPTIRGQVFVSIRQEPNNSFDLEVMIPGNTKGMVTLPLNSKQKVSSLLLNGEEVSYQRVTGGILLPSVSAGMHSIQLRMQ